MEQILEVIGNLFVNYSKVLPASVIGILAFIGTLRIVFKPLFSLAHAVVDLTPSTSDNIKLEKIEKSKAVKVIYYLLDLFASVKVEAPKK